jgi:hypothetical protein
MDWKPIRVDDTEQFEFERHPDHRELFKVRIRLTDKPSEAWVENLEEPNRMGARFRTRMEGDEIAVNIPEGEEANYCEEIERRIAATNEWYELEAPPRAKRREHAEQIEGAGEARKWDEARRRFKKG